MCTDSCTQVRKGRDKAVSGKGIVLHNVIVGNFEQLDAACEMSQQESGVEELTDSSSIESIPVLSFPAVWNQSAPKKNSRYKVQYQCNGIDKDDQDDL